MKESIPLTWRRISERYRMIGAVCSTCNSAYFPKRTICPKCRRKGKINMVQFKGTGKVYSFTEVHAPPEGFEDQITYILAIIELDE